MSRILFLQMYENTSTGGKHCMVWITLRFFRVRNVALTRHKHYYAVHGEGG